jgi:hypothetical protein
LARAIGADRNKVKTSHDSKSAAGS